MLRGAVVDAITMYDMAIVVLRAGSGTFVTLPLYQPFGPGLVDLEESFHF